MTITQCPKCGATLSESDAFCSTCGSQVGAFTEQSTPTIQPVKNTEKNKQKTKKIAFIAIVAIILCSLSLFAIKYMEKENAAKAKDAYIEGLEIQLETDRPVYLNLIFEFQSLTSDVWNNAIYKEADAETDPYTRPNGYWVNDFNEALINLYAAPSTINTLVDIENLLAEYEMFINEYKNPPEGLEQFSDLLLDLNTSYKAMVDYTINPKGTLAEFTTGSFTVWLDYLNTRKKILEEINKLKPDLK